MSIGDDDDSSPPTVTDRSRLDRLTRDLDSARSRLSSLAGDAPRTREIRAALEEASGEASRAQSVFNQGGYQSDYDSKVSSGESSISRANGLIASYEADLSRLSSASEQLRGLRYEVAGIEPSYAARANSHLVSAQTSVAAARHEIGQSSNSSALRASEAHLQSARGVVDRYRLDVTELQAIKSRAAHARASWQSMESPASKRNADSALRAVERAATRVQLSGGPENFRVLAREADQAHRAFEALHSEYETTRGQLLGMEKDGSQMESAVRSGKFSRSPALERQLGQAVDALLQPAGALSRAKAQFFGSPGVYGEWNVDLGTARANHGALQTKLDSFNRGVRNLDETRGRLSRASSSARAETHPIVVAGQDALHQAEAKFAAGDLAAMDRQLETARRGAEIPELDRDLGERIGRGGLGVDLSKIKPRFELARQRYGQIQDIDTLNTQGPGVVVELKSIETELEAAEAAALWKILGQLGLLAGGLGAAALGGPWALRKIARDKASDNADESVARLPAITADPRSLAARLTEVQDTRNRAVDMWAATMRTYDQLAKRLLETSADLEATPDCEARQDAEWFCAHSFLAYKALGVLIREIEDFVVPGCDTGRRASTGHLFSEMGRSAVLALAGREYARKELGNYAAQVFNDEPYNAAMAWFAEPIRLHDHDFTALRSTEPPESVRRKENDPLCAATNAQKAHARSESIGAIKAKMDEEERAWLTPKPELEISLLELVDLVQWLDARARGAFDAAWSLSDANAVHVSPSTLSTFIALSGTARVRSSDGKHGARSQLALELERTVAGINEVERYARRNDSISSDA